MQLDIRPVGARTGSEVRGLDLSKPVAPEIRQQLRDLFDARAVVIFRDQHLTPEEFLKVGEIFGDIMPQQVKRFTIDDHSLIGFISSEDTDKPGGKRLVRGEQYHTDHSNFPAPPMATALCAVTLPSTGGDTQFVNVLDAYDDLPDEKKKQIDGLRVLHTFLSSRSPRKKVQLTPEERAKIPETVQPLVHVHPGNHRRALYLNTAHMEGIVGMDPDAGFALIDELMKHSTQTKYEYRHQWKKGDVVIWDNRSLMHQANADYAPEEKRYLYRLMVKGQQLRPAA